MRVLAPHGTLPLTATRNSRVLGKFSVVFLFVYLYFSPLPWKREGGVGPCPQSRPEPEMVVCYLRTAISHGCEVKGLCEWGSTPISILYQGC